MDTMIAPSTSPQSPSDALEQALEQVFQLAVIHHQSGRIEEAETLYRSILQTRPNHPQANHYLGLLAVQTQQPGAGLPFFVAALEADPAEGSYWIDYIDALLQAGEAETARQVLDLGQQHGLQGSEVEMLAERLEACAPSVAQEAGGAVVGPQNGEKPASAKTVAAKTKVAPQATPGKRGGVAPSQQEINTLGALFRSGRFVEMEPLAKSLTQRFPRHGLSWKALGAALQQQGRIPEALGPLRKAAELLPQDTEALTNLGIVLQHNGRLAEAEASLRRVLRLQPNLAAAHFNLGNLLIEQNRLPGAEASIRRTLQINPNYAEAYISLGVIAEALGRLQEAEESYRKALEIRPDYAEAHGHRGILLNMLGRTPEAEANLRRALTLKEDYPEAHNNLAIALQRRGQLAEAEVSLRRALALKPDYAAAYSNLGPILEHFGRLPEAETVLRQALAFKEDSPKVHNNLAIVLIGQGRLAAAETSLRRALALKEGYAKAHNNLGNVLKDQGRLAEAAASYRRALQLESGDAMVHSNLLFCLAHDARLDAAALFAEHRRFGERFEAPLRAAWPRHPNTREPQRRLRIGLVSADLRNHAVASFLEPVLAHWAQDSGLSLHAYSTHALEDAVTQRLRGHVAHWHAVAALSEAALAEQIQADGIDILLDLSGHTAGNRLLTFARKPAPVQASWIGYAGTTGLQAMDYYLADRHFLPPGQFDGQFTEKIVQLAAGLTFQPVADAPAVNALPALAKGYVTFGSFNRLEKLSREVIALWAQVLRAVPGSRLVLGALPEADGGEAVVAWLAQEGIGRERLSLHKRCGIHEYLALHHQVDICLDTFPYNGATTSLHALWMGVPTLSLAGRTPTGRQGATVLGHVGLDEFVAWEAQEFVAKAVHWAGEVAALAQLRAGLRERVAASALGRPAVVAACLARGLRTMWQRWCAGEAPQSFEVALNDTGRSIQEGNT
jgi:protein O-GlcNAc transferase